MGDFHERESDETRALRECDQSDLLYGEVLQAGVGGKVAGVGLAALKAIMSMSPRASMLFLSGLNTGMVCAATKIKKPGDPKITEDGVEILPIDEAVTRGVDYGSTYTLWKYFAEIDRMAKLSRIQAAKTVGRNLFKGLGVQIPVSLLAFWACQRF